MTDDDIPPPLLKLLQNFSKHYADSSDEEIAYARGLLRASLRQAIAELHGKHDGLVFLHDMELPDDIRQSYLTGPSH